MVLGESWWCLSLVAHHRLSGSPNPFLTHYTLFAEIFSTFNLWSEKRSFARVQHRTAPQAYSTAPHRKQTRRQNVGCQRKHRSVYEYLSGEGGLGVSTPAFISSVGWEQIECTVRYKQKQRQYHQKPTKTALGLSAVDNDNTGFRVYAVRR